MGKEKPWRKMMGLWLKCPGCQAQNPLLLRSCPHCGQDLNNLPAAQRVYVMGPAAAAVPAASKPPAKAVAKPAIAPSPEANAATKPAKKAKRTPKKKK
jgi:hypothetical protein